MKHVLLIFFLLTFTFVLVAQEIVTVTSADANVRGTPNLNGSVVSTVKKGDRLELIIQKGDWFLLQTPKFVGWVHKDSFDEDRRERNSEPIEGILVNRRPFKDLAPLALTTFDFGPNDPGDTVDLKPFKVVLNGTLTRKMISDEYGEEREVIGFDSSKTRFVEISPQESGDPATVELAKLALQALGDSGFLGYAYNLGLSDFTITLSMNDDKIVFIYESVQSTQQRAMAAAAGLNGILAISNVVLQPGTDERILLEGARKTPVTVKDKTVKLKVEIPVETAEEMIRRSLLKEHQKASDERTIN